MRTHRLTTANNVTLDGPCNFRDLGGHGAGDATVRTGVVYRSDALHAITDADLEVIRGHLGIAHVIDLRSHGEVAEDGLGLVAGSGLRHHHIPILDQTNSIWTDPAIRLIDLYRHIVTQGAAQLLFALRAISAADTPVVFHCAAGKDRTGILAAVLLALLGVGDDDICADYQRTAQVVPLLRTRFAQRTSDPRFAEDYTVLRDLGILEATIDELVSARADTMSELLGTIRQDHRSVANWARAHGYTTKDADTLRARLLQ